MTAKEKAVELLDKFLLNGAIYSKETAKECAKICMDELIDQFRLMVPYPYKNHYEFLEEIKSEIEKL